MLDICINHVLHHQIMYTMRKNSSLATRAFLTDGKLVFIKQTVISSASELNMYRVKVDLYSAEMPILL